MQIWRREIQSSRETYTQQVAEKLDEAARDLDFARELAYGNPQMKRKLLRVLLIILVLAELWLLTGLLPQRWQEDIYARLSRARASQSHDYSRITHPNMDAELRPFEPWGMALLVVLAVVNAGAIVALWRRRNT